MAGTAAAVMPGVAVVEEVGNVVLVTALAVDIEAASTLATWERELKQAIRALEGTKRRKKRLATA